MFYEKQEYKTAIDCYSMLVDTVPRKSQAYFYRGKICEARGDIDGAIREYREAISHDARDVDTLCCIASGYVKKGDYKKGVDYYLKAQKVNPWREDILLNLGIACTELKQYDRAVHILLEALRANPFNEETRFQLGKAYCGTGNLKQAIKQTQKALETSPDCPRIHFSLGMYYEKMGWYDMAAVEYEEAFRLDKEYVRRQLLDRGGEDIRINTTGRR
jgi:tetratricopeptide (TPR) repeat protein